MTVNAVSKVSDIAAAIFVGLSKHGRSLVLADDERVNDSIDRAPIISLLSSGAVVGERVDSSKRESVRVSSLEKARNYFIERGDVLIVCRGTQVRSAIVDEDLVNTAITTSLIAVRLRHGTLLPTLLCAYLNHPSTIQGLVRATHSRTDNLNISASLIGNLQIEVPSLDVQEDLERLYLSANTHKELAVAIAEEYVKTSREAVLRRLLVR